MSGTQEKCPAAHIRNLRDGRDTPLRGVPLSRFEVTTLKL